MSDESHVPMRVAAVVVDPDTQAPVLVLRAVYDAALYLPIFIGHLEATAIATFISGMEMPRPMTHDLFVNVLSTTGWTLEEVVVTALKDKTFYAELTLSDAGGERRVLDARPSDSIALALRAGAKIRVAKTVLDEAGGRAPVDKTETSKTKADAGSGSDQAEVDDDGVVPVLDADTDLAEVDPELFGKYKM